MDGIWEIFAYYEGLLSEGNKREGKLYLECRRNNVLFEVVAKATGHFFFGLAYSHKIPRCKRLLSLLRFASGNVYKTHCVFGSLLHGITQWIFI